MELAHLDHNNNCLVYASDMKSTPPSSPDISDIVGAPQLNPRLGDEYQVETPPMITESERLKLLLSPADSELVNDHSYSFAMGLPVPLIWVHNEVEESKSSLQGQSKAYGMAPSRLSNSWSDADEKSFLLGLFIFGKNFIQIKRFLDDKGMGEIMSFYYGKFYKSNEYRRWSDCRQIKGRKCMTGQKLFTGWRQHELVSRLNSKVTEKLQDTLLQKKKLSDKLGSQWSKDELERFYEAYRKHGKDWKKVAAVERNRSTEMAYLSLPEGTASVVGLIAMMTDHYNVLEGSDSERESNDAFESGNL